MALNRSSLTEAIKAAFDAARAKPSPGDSADMEVYNAYQTNVIAQLSADLAQAIEAFIRSGEVVNVTTDVSVSVAVSTADGATKLSGTGTGSGTQKGTGKIQ